MKAFATFLLAVWALMVSAPAAAQTAEGDGVERLSTSNVGPFRPTARPDLSATQQEIRERTNAFRRQNDREPLESNDRLDATAQDFADYMARTDRYGHLADGRPASERARAHGYPYCLIAENIAYRFQMKGFRTQELAKETVEGWKESHGHRENMLRPYVTELGVGVAQSDSTGVYYLVQLFGRPRSAAIPFDLSNGTNGSIEYKLGQRSFELPPRFMRSHEMCIPAELQLKVGGGRTVDRAISGAQSLVVTSDGDRLTLEKQADRDAKPSP